MRTGGSGARPLGMDDEALDDLDRELLNAVQWDFPVDPAAVRGLGERLGIAEADGPGACRR